MHDTWCDVVGGGGGGKVEQQLRLSNSSLSLLLFVNLIAHTHIIRGKIVNCAKQRKNERTRPDVEHYLLEACAIYPMR